MATWYIVWDSKEKRPVSGPFPQNADAVTSLNRRAKVIDSKTGSGSKDQSKNFTIETVTVI